MVPWSPSAGYHRPILLAKLIWSFSAEMLGNHSSGTDPWTKGRVHWCLLGHLPCSQMSHPWGMCLSLFLVHCTSYCRLLTREAAWSWARYKEITMLEQSPGSSTHSCDHQQVLRRRARGSIAALPFALFLTSACCVHCCLSNHT